ncbi:MAG TPA: M20/M25/M40 family metallo-hydrolase [Gemmatimonadales bacterium]|nr:M20/M25/M40 family metallo-hydrolase [Gemmatimonadales bacterium]
MDPIELTRALVPIESPTFAEGPVVEFLAGALTKLGWRVVRQPVTPGRDNLYAFRERPELVFSTHLDCVPPFVPFREDERFLYGRGACDAKGIAAAMVAAAERLAALGERRIGLLFLVGEENGSDGAQKALELEPRGRFLINGEPTDNLLVTGSKGSLRVDLAAAGRAAHSAYPSEGASAILPLLETLRKIRRLPVPFDPTLGETTMNIGTLHGGVAPNVIPPEARAQVLYRTVSATEGLKRAILGCLEPGVTATFGAEIPALRASSMPGWESTVVSFASDLPFLARGWGRGFMLGPGSIRVAHTTEERIAKDELCEAVELYVRLATDLLNPPLRAA